MGYTFDVELVPPNAGATSLPLYRRSFATAKFANLTALVDDVRAETSAIARSTRNSGAASGRDRSANPGCSTRRWRTSATRAGDDRPHDLLGAAPR
jgi:hypothetical protein